MPKPVKRPRPLAIVPPRPPVFVGWVSEEPEQKLPAPDAPGVWVHTMTGTRCIVKRWAHSKELFFPAGEYSEDDFPVSKLDLDSPALQKYGFIRVHQLFDI